VRRHISEADRRKPVPFGTFFEEWQALFLTFGDVVVADLAGQLAAMAVSKKDGCNTRLAIYNELVRQVAVEHPTTDSVADLNAVVCPGGKSTPTYKGVTIRKPDGVHFTEQAGLVLAAALMPQIVAAGRAQMTRVAKSPHR
jgi:hypothetical protein